MTYVPWYYRRQININYRQVPAPLTDWPFYFGGICGYLALRQPDPTPGPGRVLHPLGYDIWFEDVDATIKYPFERVCWDPLTGACEFWIQLPAVSSTTVTTLYIAYGSHVVTTDLQNLPAPPWDANYLGVFHFGDGALAPINYDSSIYASHLGGAATAAPGLMGLAVLHPFPYPQNAFIFRGGAAHFNGSQTLTFTDLSVSGDITVEASFEYDARIGTGVEQFIIQNSDLINGYDYFIRGEAYPSVNGILTHLRGKISSTVTEQSSFLATQDLDVDAPWLTASTYNATTGDAWRYQGAAWMGIHPHEAWTTNPAIGGHSGGTIGQDFVGLIDELRVSNVARSEAWLFACENNMSNPGNEIEWGFYPYFVTRFYGVGPEEGPRRTYIDGASAVPTCY